MTYPKEQISHAINVIVDQLRVKDKKEDYVTLTAGLKKFMQRELSGYFAEVVHHNPAKIIIAPPCDKFTKENKFLNFFCMLENEGYLFPEDTCFILEPNKTFIKQNNEKTQIYDHQKRKHQSKMERMSEVTDMLRQMSLHNTYDSHSDHSSYNSSDDESLSASTSTYTPLKSVIASSTTSTEVQQVYTQRMNPFG